MLRRAALIAAVAALLLATGVQPAVAWENGGRGTDGVMRNGIGTHDWILYRAIVLAGPDAAWVNKSLALRASDDPDSYKSDIYWHHFKESGAARGAPYAVSLYYQKAVSAHQAGDYATASKYLGVLSHYYADACQPFHTTRSGSNYPKLHREYEADVSDIQRNLGNLTSWITPRAYQPVTNIRSKTIGAAKFARSRYPDLLKTYRVSHKVSSGTPRRVTREVQNRAANDLADIIRTIPTGQGLAPMPGSTSASMWRSYPRQYQRNGAYVTCLDASGKPMEGVGVKFIWRLPDGTKTILRYTNSDGKVETWEYIGAAPLMKPTYMTASIPVSGETTETETYYVASKPLDDGTDGFKSWLSSTRPRQNSNVTLSAQARDRSGNPVAGLPIRFSWSLDNYANVYTAYTDSSGVARCTRNVGNASIGNRVVFRARTQSGGYDYSYGPSFTPY